MQRLVAHHSIVPDIGREEAAKMTQRIGRGAVLTATYHLAIALATPRPKTHISVTEGKGTVTVTGPGGKSETLVV